MAATLRNAHTFTTSKREFRAGNLWAETHGDQYVVYSFGTHFPLYVFAGGVWYGNNDPSSASTLRHRNAARPSGVEVNWTTTSELRSLLDR